MVDGVRRCRVNAAGRLENVVREPGVSETRGLLGGGGGAGAELRSRVVFRRAASSLMGVEVEVGREKGGAADDGFHRQAFITACVWSSPVSG